MTGNPSLSRVRRDALRGLIQMLNLKMPPGADPDIWADWVERYSQWPLREKLKWWWMKFKAFHLSGPAKDHPCGPHCKICLNQQRENNAIRAG